MITYLTYERNCIVSPLNNYNDIILTAGMVINNTFLIIAKNNFYVMLMVTRNQTEPFVHQDIEMFVRHLYKKIDRDYALKMKS